MTKEDITKFRDEVIGDKPYRVICDNEHIFYGNIPGYFPIIWDDDAETMITIDWSRDVYSDQRLPFHITITEYEHIQYLEGHGTVAETMKMIQLYKDKLTEDQYNHCLELLQTGARNRTIIPGTRPPKHPDRPSNPNP